MYYKQLELRYTTKDKPQMRTIERVLMSELHFTAEQRMTIAELKEKKKKNSWKGLASKVIYK
jgi:hypothetical protein